MWIVYNEYNKGRNNMNDEEARMDEWIDDVVAGTYSEDDEDESYSMELLYDGYGTNP